MTRVIGYGSVEVIRGTDNEDESQGFPFTGRDVDSPTSLVRDVAGVTLNGEYDTEIQSDKLVGTWNGTDSEGRDVLVYLWELDPG